MANVNIDDTIKQLQAHKKEMETADKRISAMVRQRAAHFDEYWELRNQCDEAQRNEGKWATRAIVSYLLNIALTLWVIHLYCV